EKSLGAAFGPVGEAPRLRVKVVDKDAMTAISRAEA
ncbi:MAG: hypothetical protein JWN55_2267, partial [Frankiales bacterium]|nr:hypothetical protein [Frankiales bacterium]MCW2586751.1 hypothetical protein [Frankiales bacterium]